MAPRLLFLLAEIDARIEARLRLRHHRRRHRCAAARKHPVQQRPAGAHVLQLLRRLSHLRRQVQRRLQVTELVDKLVDLMGRLKTEITNLNPGAVGAGLSKVTEFTTGVTNLLQTAKNLLPDEAAAIDDVLAVTNVVSSLPSLDAVKGEILALLDAIIADLNSLK